MERQRAEIEGLKVKVEEMGMEMVRKKKKKKQNVDGSRAEDEDNEAHGVTTTLLPDDFCVSGARPAPWAMSQGALWLFYSPALGNERRAAPYDTTAVTTTEM